MIPHGRVQRSALLTALLFVVLVGCSQLGPQLWPTRSLDEQIQSDTAVGPDLIALTERVQPATVLVANLAESTSSPQTITGAEDFVYRGAGTGFIYDSAGYIITNNHVVEGAHSLAVVLPPPDRRVFRATLIGGDPQTDLALLKIDGPNLPIVQLGSSADLRVGQWVVAIGNALALPGGPTVSVGIVSALNRNVPTPTLVGASSGTPGPRLYRLIQTDAAINYGNSGGPLFNLRGEVVGINTLVTENAQGIGYAIAIDTAKPIVEQLRRHGNVTRGYVGIDTMTATPALAALYNLTRSSGVYVNWVDPKSPAAAAGIQRGDVIFSIGDSPVEEVGDIADAVTLRFKPGETVEIKYARGASEQVASLTLGEKPPPYGGPI